MKILHHFPLCPFSRQIRILLREQNSSFTMVHEDYWLRSQSLLALNPAGELPILVNEDDKFCGIYPVLEYLNYNYLPNFINFSAVENAEVRRIIAWFNNKFYREVVKYILDEKMIRLFLNAGSPRSKTLHVAKDNLIKHLKYFTKIVEEREFIALNQLSMADFTAAAHLSVLDFFYEIEWDQHSVLKYWYSLIKSRPSFRPLLSDRVSGFNSPKHYSDLDF